MALLSPELTQALEVIEIQGGTYDPIPAGWYNARIVEAPIKTTKNGTGQYVSIRFDITGPTHEGRVVYSNVNIINNSQEAERIGRESLKKIQEAVGISRLVDTDQLIGGALQIKVNILKSEEYGDKNETKGYKPLEGEIPASVSAPVASAAPTAATPPWLKKK